MHEIERISFVVIDPRDTRAFGYIYNTSDDRHQFWAIKTERTAAGTVLALKELFELAFEIYEDLQKAKAEVPKPISTPTSPVVPTPPPAVAPPPLVSVASEQELESRELFSGTCRRTGSLYSSTCGTRTASKWRIYCSLKSSFYVKPSLFNDDPFGDNPFGTVPQASAPTPIQQVPVDIWDLQTPVNPPVAKVDDVSKRSFSWPRK